MVQVSQKDVEHLWRAILAFLKKLGMALKIFVQGIWFVVRTAWKYMVQIYIVATAIVLLMLLNGFGSFQEVLTEGNTIEYARAEEVATTTVPEIVQIAVEIDWTDKERVKQEVDTQAKAFGTSAAKMHVTIDCESQYNVKSFNGSDPYGGAHGVAQFLPPTFNKYAPLAGVTNPDIWNPIHQLQTMAYMFSIGEAKQWTCFRTHYR